MSESICGLYLFTIWLFDYIFQGVHLINKDLWKSHPICFAAHGLVLWFTISIPIILINLSAARLTAILYPLKTRIKSQKEAIYQLSIIHLFALCVSIFLTLVLKFTEKHVPTSLCLPFIDPSGSSILSKVISCIVIIIQSIFSVIISAMNIFSIMHVNKSVGFMQKSESLINPKNKLMLFQLILTSISNMLCWFPVNAIYISAMFLSVYPSNLVIWTTVIIMPLNSMINPCIFILMKLKSS